MNLVHFWRAYRKGQRPHAKDIDDLSALRVVAEGHPEWPGAPTPITYAAKRLGGYPPKVVLAKLRALCRRGLVAGCTCGCRGDFTLTAKGRELLRADSCEGRVG